MSNFLFCLIFFIVRTRYQLASFLYEKENDINKISLILASIVYHL